MKRVDTKWSESKAEGAPRPWLPYLTLAMTALLGGCAPGLVTNIVEPGDLTPPSVVAWSSDESRGFLIEFDEDVSAEAGAFAVSPALDILGVSAEGRSVSITLGAEAAPGAPYALEGEVRDGSGNSTSFVLPFWGYNPQLPSVLINEALTQGSSTHPDAVELVALDAGNLAGLTLFVGSLGYPVLRYVFPSCMVEAGEFIVLHLKPQGIEAEVDELGDPAASGGLDAFAYARDFWYRGGDGALPGENGALSLYRSPRGPLRDALLYSARTSESDTKYSGFGTQALLNQAQDLVSADGWAIEKDAVRPEDAARSQGVTSTRTLCRSSDSADSDSSADWHVVPTKGSTLGRANTDDVYSP